MSDNRLLIERLKKTKKMSNKYLAKRIMQLDSSDRNMEKAKKEQKKIKKKCYELLLELIDDTSKIKLLKIDAIMAIIQERINSSTTEEDIENARLVLNSCYIEKDYIIEEESYPKNEKDEDLVNSLIEFLGYSKETKKDENSNKQLTKID